MARLNQINDSDDEFPELSTLLRPFGDGDIQASERASKKRDDSGRLPLKGEPNNATGVGDKRIPVPRNVAQLSPEEKHSSGPFPLGLLKLADINALHVPHSTQRLDGGTKSNTAKPSTTSNPRKTAKPRVDYSKLASRLSDASLSVSDSDSFTDLSGFIVPDSASDEEILPSTSRNARESRKTTKKSRDQQSKEYASSPVRSPSEEQESTGRIYFISPKRGRKTSNLVCPESPPRFRTPPKISDRVEQHSDLDQPCSKMRLSVPIVTEYDYNAK